MYQILTNGKTYLVTSQPSFTDLAQLSLAAINAGVPAKDSMPTVIYMRPTSVSDILRGQTNAQKFDSVPQVIPARFTLPQRAGR